ncbi:hypothetical protein FRB94_002430 [Tulasnella sp. JGI-2019a]|nr:hypothetical protein FRB94_002430 [Tulasnella sp. JGI-2019a]
MFRVHKGVVARQSEVFKDMFEITGPVSDGTEDEVFENAPVIKVEDKAADIRALFSLMYNAPPRDVPLDLIASTLRVADKYGIEQYQAWALSCLKEYPTADNTVAQVYDHPKWKAFADPYFCINLIRLTDVLNRSDLEGLTRLAYYGLNYVN